jgi:hypothetical protein
MPANPSTKLEKLPAVVRLIERRIYLIRSQKVMLDSDLADLYQLPTYRLNEAVKRNKSRFPFDFMFQLNSVESANLTSQFAISSSAWGGRRHRPYAFTEHGVAMLSSILNTDRAVQLNIQIIRAFIKLREMLATHKDFAHRLEKLESEQKRHKSMITILAGEIGDLKCLPAPGPKRPFGFPILPAVPSRHASSAKKRPLPTTKRPRS